MRTFLGRSRPIGKLQLKNTGKMHRRVVVTMKRKHKSRQVVEEGLEGPSCSNGTSVVMEEMKKVRFLGISTSFSFSASELNFGSSCSSVPWRHTYLKRAGLGTTLRKAVIRWSYCRHGLLQHANGEVERFEVCSYNEDRGQSILVHVMGRSWLPRLSYPGNFGSKTIKSYQMASSWKNSLLCTFWNHFTETWHGVYTAVVDLLRWTWSWMTGGSCS